MEKIRFGLLTFAMMVSTAAFVSCSDDEDTAQGNQPTTADLQGEYTSDLVLEANQSYTLSGGEHTFSFAQAEQTLDAGTHDLLAVTTDYEDAQNIVYELLKADGSTCYSKISENGTKMRLFEGEHLLTASMTVNDIRYRAITKLSVSPAPVYDAATIEDFDNSYSQDNLEHTQHWNHIHFLF